MLAMTMGLVVSGTKRDLAAEARSLDEAKNAARAQYDELKPRYNQLQLGLDFETRAARFQLRKLEAERVGLLARNAELKAELDDLRDERSRLTADVTRAQENNSQLADRVEQLRAEIAANDEARMQAFEDSLKTTEELHQLVGQLEHTLERNRDLQDALTN